MSNLSELLPAGGGGKNVDFVASGTLPNGKTVILNSDGTVTSVAMGTVDGLAAGTSYPIDTPWTQYLSVAMLTSTKAIVAYTDNNDVNGYGSACVLDISGSVITPATPVTFNSSQSLFMSITALSSTKAIVTYSDVGNSDYIKASVLDVSGSSITAGSSASFGVTAEHNSVSALSATKAIVAYNAKSNSDYGTTRILDVSGNSVTVGSAVVFNSDESMYPVVSMLTATKAIVAYKDGGNSSQGTSCILDVSNSSITVGSKVVFGGTSIGWSAITALSSTKAVVAYRNGGNSGYGTSCVLDVSNSSITANTNLVFKSADSRDISLTSLTATRAIVTYQDLGNSTAPTATVLDVSGSSIAAGSTALITTSHGYFTSVAMLTSTEAIVVFRNASVSGAYGNAAVLNTQVQGTNLTSTNLIGITDAAIANTETGSVTIKGGLKSGLTGLTPNSIYYTQGDGSISTVSTAPAVRIGRALSSTTLNLEFN